MEKISPEKIYNKLEQLERLLRGIMRKEISELRLLGKEVRDNKKRVYNDVTEWKLAIWDVCDYRMKKADAKGTYYKCEKTKKYCNFSNCPKNLV